MQPRWETWVVLAALGAPACSVRRYQEFTVVVQPQEPLRGYAAGPLSLGESPGDLRAEQINAALEGHGVWVDSGSYGRVWRPHEAYVIGTFAPYATAGQWVATDAGWYWQSDYAWGRVPFHYGRWVLDGALWSWVPGSQFAPAWVDWRVGGGWVGWAALGPVGARAWAPFAYCPHAGLPGPGVDGRTVRGAAGSSLYGRTVAVPTDGDTPRGPAMPSGVSGMSVARAWGAAPAAATPAARPPVALASLAGIDSVERIPVARDPELPPRVDPPVGGAAVVIRDRDLAGMSEGPSVRRPAGAVTEVLPDPVNTPRRAAPVVVPPAAWTRVAAAPPLLPPPPDGASGGGYFGAYPGRPPVAFASRRAPPGGPSDGEHTVVVAPSPQPAAPPVAQPAAPARGAGVSGAWIGPSGIASSAAPVAGPFRTLR
jgi:hypothetical protein